MFILESRDIRFQKQFNEAFAYTSYERIVLEK